VLVVVNLDTRWVQGGFTDLDLEALGLDDDEPFEAHDLLSGERYPWRGARNFVELDPWRAPAHLLRLRSLRPPEQQTETDAATDRTEEAG
jgi:starch synthase (maltosyl-transferring)